MNVRRKMSSPLTIGHVSAIIALVVLVGGGFAAWGSLKTESKISDVTTGEQLEALEDKHDREMDKQDERHKEDHTKFEVTLEKLDLKQDQFQRVQIEQTVILREIRDKVK